MTRPLRLLLDLVAVGYPPEIVARWGGIGVEKLLEGIEARVVPATTEIRTCLECGVQWCRWGFGSARTKYCSPECYVRFRNFRTGLITARKRQAARRQLIEERT